MASDRIVAALEGASDTRAVRIGAGVLDSVPEVLAEAFGDGGTAVVVADETTWGIAGERVRDRLEGAGRRLEAPFLFPGRPVLHANYEPIEELVAALRAHDAVPVAVGSGTLNDITKRAAFECERPYLCVGTAASMDGYTAFGASITKDGYKHTMECSAPRALVADVEVLTRAPPAMTASGYADLLGKVTAGADWIVADLLEVEAIDAPVWSLVQDGLREATGRPAELHAGDPGAMDALMEALVLAGLAMQASGSSRPASGAEHQFSHLWEMEGLGADGDPPLSHGFKVGLGTISIARLYERLLERDLTRVQPDPAWPSAEELERRVRAAHPEGTLADAAVRESLAKHPDPDALAARLALVRERWPELRERARAQLLPANALRERLEAAGCPTTPEAIGLTQEDLRATFARARMIRRRYTALDLAAEAGVLDECVAELFD